MTTIKLVISADGAAPAEEFFTNNRRLRVGRAPGLDVSRPSDTLISNRHCVITNGVLVDRASTNGTFLNGNQVEYETPVVLKGGDVIGVGSTVINAVEVDLSEDPQTEPEPAALGVPSSDMFLVHKGQKHFLPGQTIKIGRASHLDIIVDDKLVSANHCVVANGELLDERSTNGTFVNGRQVPYCLEQALKVGDRVRVGEVTMTVVAATEDEAKRWHQKLQTSGAVEAEASTSAPSVQAAQTIRSANRRTVAFADQATSSAAPAATGEEDEEKSEVTGTVSKSSSGNKSALLGVVKGAVALAAVVAAGVWGYKYYEENIKGKSSK